MKPSKKGATPRKLNERELHYELRRADEIIANAYHLLSADDSKRLDAEQAATAITGTGDPMGNITRHAALNRITPQPDHLKITLIALCIFLGWAWYAAQLDRDLLIQQIAQGEHHGSSHQTRP